MKVVVIAQYDPNLFPAIHYLAVALTEAGCEVTFVAGVEPTTTGANAPSIGYARLPKVTGVVSRVPWFRSNHHRVMRVLRRERPDWIVAQHEYLIPALVYKAWAGTGRVKVAAYFGDHHNDRAYVKVATHMAGLIDAYIDVCDLRARWRQESWPRMRAETFVIRQAPLRREAAVHDGHHGDARVVFTGSKNVLGMDRARLVGFIRRLCEEGVSVDWYLPGTPDVRTEARSLVAHPRYRVHDAIEKTRLIEVLAGYDVGLFWAPMAEWKMDERYFRSAASNKVGEYIAAGLVVAHTGNPGLSFLPAETYVAFDPTDPEAGALQLAKTLRDRGDLERRRAAALKYHQKDLHFTAQSRALLRYMTGAGEGGHA